MIFTITNSIRIKRILVVIRITYRNTIQRLRNLYSTPIEIKEEI